MDNINTKIGIQIREFRKKANMTQQALADAIHVTKSTISRIENGKYDISYALYMKIRKVLNIESQPSEYTTSTTYMVQTHNYSPCDLCIHKSMCQFRHEGIEISFCKYSEQLGNTIQAQPVKFPTVIPYPDITTPITWPTPTKTGDPIWDTQTLNYIPDGCKNCSNHPSNGGSGVCHCTIGTMGQVTC